MLQYQEGARAIAIQKSSQRFCTGAWYKYKYQVLLEQGLIDSYVIASTYVHSYLRMLMQGFDLTCT